jgi:hypothetical protein
MLDRRGQVAEASDAHIFLIKDGLLRTQLGPWARHRSRGKGNLAKGNGWFPASIPDWKRGKGHSDRRNWTMTVRSWTLGRQLAADYAALARGQTGNS